MPVCLSGATGATRRPSKGVDELVHINKRQGVSCWTACLLHHPPPLDGSLQRTSYIRGSRVISASHPGTPNSSFPQGRVFPMATCQRQTHRQLALELASHGLARLGDLSVVFPERGPWFFHLLLRLPSPRHSEGGWEATLVPAGLRARQFC